jgi:hypothetical protein
MEGSVFIGCLRYGISVNFYLTTSMFYFEEQTFLVIILN